MEPGPEFEASANSNVGGKNTTVFYKEVLGFVTTTQATTSSSTRPHDIHRRVI